MSFFQIKERMFRRTKKKEEYIEIIKYVVANLTYEFVIFIIKKALDISRALFYNYMACVNGITMPVCVKKIVINTKF